MPKSHFERYSVNTNVPGNVVDCWPTLPSRTSVLAKQVWAIDVFRRRMFELMPITDLLSPLRVNHDTFGQVVKEVWKVVEPTRFIELAKLRCPASRMNLYNAAVSIVDLRTVARSYKKFDDISSWIGTFPNAQMVLTEFATIKRLGTTPDGSPIIQVILERNREIPGLEIPPCDTYQQIARQFPQHWQVQIGFKLGIIDRLFQSPSWTGKSKGKGKTKVTDLDLQDIFSNLKGNLESHVPNLTVWAPVSLHTIAAYHQKKLATGAPTTPRYTIYTHDYKIEDVKKFALSTMGSIDMLDLRLHVNFEAEITMHQILCEFEWTFFYGIKEVDITVAAPYADPEKPYEGLGPLFSGHSLNLKSFTLRFHWLMEAHEGPFPVIRFFDLASALLPIGGPLCEYSIAFTESQEKIEDQKKRDKREAAEGWLTASLRIEIEKLKDAHADWFQPRGWAKIQREEINMWGQPALPYVDKQGVD